MSEIELQNDCRSPPKRNWLRAGLLAAVVAFLSTGPAHSAEAASEAECVAKLQREADAQPLPPRPRSMPELMRNLKLIVERRPLLRSNIYDGDTIASWLGGHVTTRIENADGARVNVGRLDPFAPRVVQPRLDQNKISSWDLFSASAFKGPTPTGYTKEITINLLGISDILSTDSIKKEFGPPWVAFGGNDFEFEDNPNATSWKISQSACADNCRFTTNWVRKIRSGCFTERIILNQDSETRQLISISIMERAD